MKQWMIIAIFCGLPLAASQGAEPVDFVRDIRPILQNHCYECHAAKIKKSGLRLDIHSEAMKGGEIYGEAIHPGKPEESPLWQFVANDDADLVMPPKGNPLSKAEVATLARWIKEGAVWPEGVDTAKLEDRGDHWSFKPIQRPAAPVVARKEWPRNAIDNFVLAKLESKGLSPAPAASRVDWLRRVSLDLVGLPPTQAEVQAFLADQGEDAYEKVVSRLLDSPRYGERWTQHWLDVVRYADTHGFEVNTERPNAWPYRDYVIEALNHDIAYDQFVREQIAGDAMNADAATGFLVTASVLLPGQIGKDDLSKRLARQDSLDEIVTNIGTTFLGLTIQCARCHDHKFDPLSQEDYYSMQAFVAGVEYRDREIEIPIGDMQRDQQRRWTEQLKALAIKRVQHVPVAGSKQTRAMVNSFENIDRFKPVVAKAVRFHVKQTNRLEPCIDELEVFNTDGVNVALASTGAKATASGSNVSPNRHELRFVNDGIYGNSNSWMSNEMGGGWVEVQLAKPQPIDHVVWGRDRLGKFSDRLAIQYMIEVQDASGNWQTVADSSDRAAFVQDKNAHEPIAIESLPEDKQQEIRTLNQENAALLAKLQSIDGKQEVFAGTFRNPDEIRVLGRGSPELPKQVVSPAVPVVLGDLSISSETPEQNRRLALAKWITSPDNPLTARVMANRIWQGHFGTGLVETANDFGRNGLKPSHPELLDWLSRELMDGGWSLKNIHRQIVLSATYRQSSQFNEEADKIDAGDRLLWHFPPQRMMGEVVRDSLLSLCGDLNLEMGGPGYSLFDKRGGLTGFSPIESFDSNGHRRMIYAHRVRRERDAVFGAFDCPDYGQSTSRRRESTTSIQALNLFNSRFMIEQSRELAKQIQQSHPTTEAQVIATFELVLLRPPNSEELPETISFVEQHGLDSLCRVLFNSNEFLFIR
ncbi:DUF1553 domain-containing protein [bacterium]|nr:DUF1553 domain-containing protein [bacterium]